MRSERQVFVVEASAGSGKTYCLARRYVQLSLRLAAAGQVLPIQSILAITFTNKAAWEMKSRILDFLKRISLKQLNPEQADDILKPLGLNESDASKLALRLMNEVIRQYHYFQVQTIDSFVNILLSGCSFKIGLSAHFRIQRNSREYLQLSLDELLDQADSDKKARRLFEDFVRQYLFLENRSGWFPKEDLLKVIIELFRQYNTYQKPLLVYPYTEDIFVLKKKIYGLMQELKTCCPAQTSRRFLDHLEELLANTNGIIDVDDLANTWAKEDFPVNKGGEPGPQALALWRQITQEICGLCLLEARGLFNPYVVLFERLLSCFGQLCRRDDVLFLEELNRKAGLLFEEGLVSVEELYLRLAARIRHYLIDEFQDTSLSQWRNLSPMVEEALAQRGSLFYVGDKKQAIYSFRGGESRLFDALQSRLSDFNIQLTNLDKNFRSCPEIIAFNNQVFSLENLRDFLQRRLEDSRENKRANDIHFSQEDFQQIVHTFAHAHQAPGKGLAGGLARVNFIDGRTKQERSGQVRQKLIALIKDAARRFALRDIAILTRGNDEVEEITQWLLQEGIGASSERSSDIKNNPLVAELMNLLVFFHAPADNNAFAQVCLGELLGRASGLGPEALRDFLFTCARESSNSRGFCFYKKFREAFPCVWQALFEKFFQQAGVSPLYELTAGIIHGFRCEEFFPQAQGFFMQFLELIKKQEKEGCDLSSFADFYDNLEGEERFVPMTQMNAVRVTTVHKAKGLEFPVVIVPFLEMDIKAGSGGRDGGQAYVLDVQEKGVALLRLKEAYRKFCPELQARYEEEYKKSFLVELNSVYVAMTRAIEELYVFVPGRVGNTVNPARFLIPEDCWSRGTAAARPETHQPPEVHRKIKPFIGNPWGYLQHEFADQPIASAALALQGEFYHALLMQVGRIDKTGLEEALEGAWDQACRRCGPVGDRNEVLRQMHEFIDRDEVRPFFYLPEDAQVFCEKEFANAYGDGKRIDRLVVLKDAVWVVDYKLSPAAEARHEGQVEEYMELVRSFYPNHAIQGKILYFKNA